MNIPITDNHAHINLYQGLGVKAVEDFVNCGGRNLLLVNLLCKHYGLPYLSCSNFKKVISKHLETVQIIKSRFPNIRVYAVVGPHPAEITELLRNSFSLTTAKKFMMMAIDIATALLKEDIAVALGEVGRPHYPVPREVWEVSNEILKYAFQRACEVNKPVQVHMEKPTLESLNEIAEIAEKVGFETSRIIIHHSPPIVKIAESVGVLPSIVAKRSFIIASLKEGKRFLLETDYLDDPRRPGAVLSLRTIPRRIQSLLNQNKISLDTALYINVYLPEKVYGVDFH